MELINLGLAEVLLSSKLPCSVCGWIYHDNIVLLLEELHRKLPDDFTLYGEEFIKLCACNTTNKKCMTWTVYFARLNSKQPICMKSTRNILRVAATWYHWEKDEDGQTEKNEKKGTFENLLPTLPLLTSCKQTHIKHADWLQQQQIPTQQWYRWTSPVFIRMRFPMPTEKQCHTVQCHDLVQEPKYINGPFVR